MRGTAVLDGYGDPRGSAMFVDPTVTGIYMASASDLSFSRLFTDSVTCLTWVSSGVYACTELAEENTYEELAFFRNTDLVVDGGAPTYLMKLDDVLGPPPCCAAAAAACDPTALSMTYPFFACARRGNDLGVLRRRRATRGRGRCRGGRSADCAATRRRLGVRLPHRGVQGGGQPECDAVAGGSLGSARGTTRAQASSVATHACDAYDVE